MKASIHFFCIVVSVYILKMKIITEIIEYIPVVLKRKKN